MFLAEEAAQAASKFTGFDPFVILFTIIIAIGVVRLVTAPKKNLFAIGFSSVSLLVFLVMDAVMVLTWMDIM
jgi:arginine exporter protein ArgO